MFKRVLRFIGRAVVVVACVVAIFFLGRALVDNFNAVSNTLGVNAHYSAAQASYPGSATAISFANATLAVKRTSQPTNTPTVPPTEETVNTCPEGFAPDPQTGQCLPAEPETTTTQVGGVYRGNRALILARAQIVTATPQGPAVTPTSGPLPTNTKRPTSTEAAPPEASASPVAATSAPLKVPTVPLLAIPTTARVQQTAIPSPAPRQKAGNFDVLNIVLIGSDQDVDPSDPSFRTDSMLVVSINRTTNTVSMLSLPRDLYVYIPTYGMQRLNVAYGYGQSIGFQPGGGFGLLQQTVLYNFGIPLHYYARISLNGFKSIIDSFNGVDIAVDCPISDLRYQGPVTQRTPEPSEYTPFDLKPGYYHMNGAFALWYARVRKSTSDFDRSRRQQQVLRAMWRTAREQNLAAKIPELWGPITSVMQTNLSLPDILSLVPVALAAKPGDIRSFYMSKGYELQHFAADGADVQIPMLPGFFDTIGRFYTPPTTNKTGAESYSIEVMNGTQSKDLDKVAVDRLSWGGFDAQAKGDGDIAPKTVVYDYTGSAKPASLTAMLKALNVKTTAVISQPDPNRTVDFRVVLGADYNSCSASGFTK